MTVPRTNEGTYTAVFLRIIVDTPAMWLVVLAGPAYIISRIIGRTGRLTTANWLLLLLVAATVVPLNQRWFLKYDDFNAEIREPGHEEFMLGRRDVIDGAMLVRNNTPADAIIMSNHFCERPICALADYGPHRINWKRGGEAMTLTVYSQRRFWVNGYGFLWQNVEPPVDIRRRIADSLDPRGARVAADFYLRDTSASGLIPGERIPLVRSDRFALYPR
jgi:hypothetical protein